MAATCRWLCSPAPDSLVTFLAGKSGRPEDALCYLGHHMEALLGDVPCMAEDGLLHSRWYEMCAGSQQATYTPLSRLSIRDALYREAKGAFGLCHSASTKHGSPTQLQGAALEIAQATFTTPLVTVLAAQLVARDDISLTLLNNTEDFRTYVLASLRDVIAAKLVIGQDVPS